MPISRAEFGALVPHAGSMCLWDEVLEYDGTSIRAASRGHLDPSHPLRLDGRLSSIHLIEYGAQLAAVHGGLLARDEGISEVRPGMLAAVRDAKLEVGRLDDLGGALEGTGKRIVANPGGVMYEFEIRCGGTMLAQGRISVIFPS